MAEVRPTPQFDDLQPGLLFEQSPVPMLLLDLGSARIATANDAAARCYGYAREEFPLLSLTHLRATDDPGRLADPPDADGGVVSRGEARHRRRDGTVFDAEVTTQDLRVEGRLLRMIMVRDLSGRNRAARRLARLHDVTSMLAEAVMPDEVARAVVDQGIAALGAHAGSLALLDESGAELEVLRTLGYPAEASERWRRIPLDHPSPLADALRTGAALFLSGPEERARVYPGPEESRGGAMAAVPLAVGGRALGVIGLEFPRGFELGDEERAYILTLAQQGAQALDRAQLFAAERQARAAAEAAALREQAALERMAVLADAGSALAASLDSRATLDALATLLVPRVADWCFVEMPTPDGRIEAAAVRHARAELTAFAWDALRRHPADPAHPFGTEAVLRTGVSELVEEVTPERIEALARDEEHLQLLRLVGFDSHVVVPLRSGGRILGTLALVMAGSGRRFGRADLSFVEELARRAAASLENGLLYEAAQGAREAAEEANRVKTQFLSAMSHELRTPLNAIAGYADLLDLGVYGPLADDQRRAIARIRVAEEHLLALINDVLGFARMEAGRIDLRVDVVPMQPLLDGLEPLLAPQLGGRSLEYHSAPAEPAGLAARGDGERIRQVLLNLLSNAVKFTPEGGRIAVAARAEHGVVAVRVSDTGIGIPADKLEAVFEPFVQLGREGATAEVQGVGLGLAISRELARAMGGELVVESVFGEGSTFCLVLPIAEE